MSTLPALALHARSIALETLTTPAGPGAKPAADPKSFDLKSFDLKSFNPKSKARSTAVDFEAQFLNSMFNNMFAGIDGDGPFGGGPAVGVWRSFLSEQYAKTFAKAGGIGIADHVYSTLIAQQEAQARPGLQPTTPSR
jgi:flagellar protein FlgJ